eukprot:9499668-Pyramimonas_sp.AAC.1
MCNFQGWPVRLHSPHWPALVISFKSITYNVVYGAERAVWDYQLSGPADSRIKTTVPVTLAAGSHTIEAHYLEIRGGARLSLEYAGPDTGSVQMVIPPTHVAAAAPGAPLSAEVTVNGLSALLPGAFHYDVAATPAVARVEPALVAPEGGNLVTVTGAGFLPGEPGLHRVLFGDRSCAVQSVNATGNVVNVTDGGPGNPANGTSEMALVCAPPPGGAGTLPVSVRVLGRGAAGPADPFTVTYPLRVTSAGPLEGSAFGGTLLVVRGAGFPGPDGNGNISVGLGPRASEVRYPCEVVAVAPEEVRCVTGPADGDDYGRALQVRGYTR